MSEYGHTCELCGAFGDYCTLITPHGREVDCRIIAHELTPEQVESLRPAFERIEDAKEGEGGA